MVLFNQYLLPFEVTSILFAGCYDRRNTLTKKEKGERKS